MAEHPSPELVRQRRERRVVLSGVLCAFALTWGATQASWIYRETVLRRQLEDSAGEIERNLQRQAADVEAYVGTIAAFFEASVRIDRAEFAAFVGRTGARLEGLAAVEWQAWVPTADRAAFEARMRADGLVDFAIVERGGDGRLVPAGERPVHLPIVHAFSPGGVASEIGLDLAASGEWLEEKLASLDAPGPMASPPLGIMAADGRGAGEGFTVSDAVLWSGTAPARARLQGFVTATFAYRPLISAALAGTHVDQMQVRIADAATGLEIFASRPARGAMHPDVAGRRFESTISVAGRTWTLAAAPTPALYSYVILVLPWAVLAVCVFTGAAILGIVHMRRRGRVERERQARIRLASEARFHEVVDRMLGAVLLMRAAAGGRFVIVDTNDAAVRLFGLDRGDVLGREFDAVVPGARAAGLSEALVTAWTNDGANVRRSADLTIASAVRHVDAVFFRVGEGEEICGIVHDHTGLKSVERELRQARDELEFALDVSRVGLWTWDMGTRRLRIDHRCARLYGLAGAGVIDDSVVTQRIHSEDLRYLREEVARAVKDNRSYEVEYRYTLEDGGLRHLCSRARPVREPGAESPRIVGCTWDVTERRRLEEHLRRSQRLESLGTLAGGVAHDLNNALAPVTMGLDLLKRRLGGDADAVESIQLMQTSVRRASTIVRQLIAFKRGAGESRNPAPAHPRRILEILGTTLGESFPREITIELEPASLDLPRVVADEREAHQVLLNLCVNARDAMPKGGRLTIACEALEVSTANQADYPGLRSGNYVVFRVADTGAGIPADIRHRVFDPFFTTRDVGKGSGLGLSTALGIVKAHRGAIQFESKEGVGTTFLVILPAVADEEPPRTVEVASIATTSEGATKPCLLLVDDEQQVRELSRRALEQSGFRVLTAANGREAVDLFTQHQQKIDAVVMDLLMPVMNGAAATAAIKRVRPEVPVVGASGFATDALVEEARAAGITAFLPKPFTVAVLVDAVRAAMVARGPRA